MNAVGTAILVIVLLIAGAGCATNPVTGKRDFVVMSEEDEIQVGHQVARQVLQQYRVYDDPALAQYVQAVGERLAAVGERPHLNYRFTVLDSDEVNAFAVPGGYIYITRGLLAYLNSEAELAAVLGHEIGHVTGRHAVKQQSAGTLTNILGTVAAAATGVGGTDIVTGLLGNVFIKGYGRDMELQADSLGAEYLARTGYDPDAMIDVIRVLKDQEAFEIERATLEGREPQVYHGIFSTHPDQDTRLKEVVGAASTLSQSAGTLENRYVYMHHMDGLVFGKTDLARAARAGEFLHPSMGLAVKLPLGWRVETRKDGLMAQSPRGDGVLQLSMQPLTSRIHPRDFLSQRLADPKLVKEDEFSTAGFPGYTAVALKSPSPFGDRAVRYGIIYIRNQAYVVAGAAEKLTDPYKYDREFRSAIESVRPMTNQELRIAAPSVIRVIRAEDDTRIERLASASRLPEYAVQQIRLINGLYPDGEPAPGEYIKTLE